MSGSSNAGMWWWISGYGRADGFLQLDGLYPEINKAVSLFTRKVDFSKLSIVEMTASPGIEALGIGSSAFMMGYARDSACLFPDWKSVTVSGQTITLAAPWNGSAWVVLYKPEGLGVIQESRVDFVNGSATLNVPSFQEDIAFKIYKP